MDDINACGGEQYAKKEIIEVEAESPEVYVKANGRLTVMDISTNAFAGNPVTPPKFSN